MQIQFSLSLLTLLLLSVACTRVSVDKPAPHIELQQEQDTTEKTDQLDTRGKPEKKDEFNKLKHATPESSKPSIVTIDSEGRLIVNGKPFFTIGIYSVPIHQLKEAKALGFNSVHNYGGEGTKANFIMHGRAQKMLRFLNAAHQQGLMVWMGLPRYEIIHDYTPVIKRQIETLKNSPALLAWYLYDEPDCENVPASNIQYVANMIQQQDPNHPSLLVLCKTNEKSQEFYSIPDIMLTDYYPIGRPGIPIGAVHNRITKVNKQLAGHIPIWSVIQLHGKGPGGRGYGLKEPNYKEIRNMTYQSIVSGAKGLLFFTFHGTQFKLFESPQGLKNIKKLTSELKKLSPVFLSPSGKPDFIAKNKPTSIRTKIFKFQNKYYLFIVNLSRKPINFKLKISKRPKSITEISSSRIINLKNQKLIDKLSPIGVNIYELAY